MTNIKRNTYGAVQNPEIDDLKKYIKELEERNQELEMKLSKQADKTNITKKSPARKNKTNDTGK